MYEQTGEMPPALAEKPTLTKVWEFPLKVYTELRHSRNQNMNGRGYIPYSELSLYAKDRGYVGYEITDLWEKVHAVDHIHQLEYTKIDEAHAAKQKKAK